MKVKELITILSKYPQIQDLDIVLSINDLNGSIDNHWINDIEFNVKGDSGYEEDGEVRLIG